MFSPLQSSPHGCLTSMGKVLGKDGVLGGLINEYRRLTVAELGDLTGQGRFVYSSSA